MTDWCDDKDWHYLVNLENSIGYQLREANRAADVALAARLSRHDIPIGMWFYLRILWQHPGINQSELSRRINATSATTAVQLAKMEQMGLIERSGAPEDKRLLRVHLTERGKALEAELMPEALRHREQMVAEVAPEDLATTMRVLRKIRENAKIA
jgi:MarR family transcriptional regulator, organic hydroperoxide resistance regulator